VKAEWAWQRPRECLSLIMNITHFGGGVKRGRGNHAPALACARRTTVRRLSRKVLKREPSFSVFRRWTGGRLVSVHGVPSAPRTTFSITRSCGIPPSGFATGAGGVNGRLVRVIGSLGHTRVVPAGLRLCDSSVAMVCAGLRLPGTKKIRNAVAERVGAACGHASERRIGNCEPIPSRTRRRLPMSTFWKPLSIPP